MAIDFSSVGKKLSEGSKSAVNKTKDFAEVVKVKSKLSDEQNKLEDLYGELGEAYYSEFGDNPDEKLKDLCKTIYSYKEKIKKLEIELKGKKGIRICPNCGADITEDDKFCKKCGAKIE